MLGSKDAEPETGLGLGYWTGDLEMLESKDAKSGSRPYLSDNVHSPPKSTAFAAICSSHWSLDSLLA